MSANLSKFFVSYSHRDQGWADVLFDKAIQTTRGISAPSIDFQRLVPGEDFDKVLKREIEESDGFVFLVSKRFLQSKYVQNKEWKWINESAESMRVCCIEIGTAISGTSSENDSELLIYLKKIHRDKDAHLPVAVPKSAHKLEQCKMAVRRSIERMLDPDGVRITERLEARQLQDIEWLTDGKLATLYSARTATFGRKLAVKVPHDDSTDEFLNSLKTAEKISTIPNIVRIYEVNKEIQPFYCITELIEGQTLAELFEEKEREERPIPLQLARNVLLKLALALRSIHKRGMYHLNIRPKNILIDAFDEPYLLPTGRARDGVERRWQRQDSASANSETGLYAVPEYIRGDDWNEESADIFSLGLIGYWMIAGRLPEQNKRHDESEPDSWARPEIAALPSLISRRPDCPVSLDHTVMRMLHIEPTHRYQKFKDVLAGLSRYPDKRLAVAERSWQRCLNAQENIFQRFYEQFFADAGRDVEEMFTKPWPTLRQKNLLRDAVINLFQYYDLKRCYRDVPPSLNPLEGLASQHAGRNILPAHFQTFARALIDTVVTLDSAADATSGDDDPIRQAWKAVIEPGADYLRRRVAEISCQSAD